MEPTSIIFFSGMLFNSTRSSFFDESPIAHSSYARQQHSMRCFRR